MIIIENKIVEDEIIQEEFLCNLDACKGACCWEGDLGAPLEAEEVDILEKNYDKIRPYLTKYGQQVIDNLGVSVFEPQSRTLSTPLIDNAACAFMTRDDNGVAKCGIEEAYLNGDIDYKKPISCHLYPIRIEQKDTFEHLRYDRWDICSAACTKGKEAQLPIYKFLKEALIRKYGEDFYEQLEATAGAFEK